MTVQFLAKKLQPHVRVIVRMPIGYTREHGNGTMYMKCEDTNAGTLANVNSRFYDEHRIVDFFFNDDFDMVMTIE